MALDLSTAPRGELIRLIYKLIDENQILKESIIDLKEQMNQKDDKGGKSIPEFVKANVKKKKAKERRQRENGFSRKLDTPTQTIFHSYEVCPNCDGALGKPSVAYTRQIIDIPQVKAAVTEHVVFKRWCFNCQKRMYPKVNLNSLVVGKSRFGVNVMSMISTLRECFLNPLGSIKNQMKLFYGLDLSEGEIVDVLDKTAKFGKTDYQNILTEIKKGNVIHADETGWRENGRNGYWWNFSNQTCQFLIYRKSRAAKVVTEVLGEDGKEFEGILTTDFYSSYNEYAGFHQRCWVHYLRDIDKLKEDYPKDKQVKKWAKNIHSLYQEAKLYPGPAPNLLPGIQDQQRQEKEGYFKQRLKALCEPLIVKDLPMSKLSSRAIRFLPEMFTFIRFPDISSDNNKAERDIRHTVVSRKISGGTKSEKGSQTKSVLASLFGTWKLQGLNPLEQCRLLLANPACQRL